MLPVPYPLVVPSESTPPHNEAKLLLTRKAHMLDQVVNDLQRCSKHAVLVTPIRKEHTAWYSRARHLSAEYNILRPMDQPHYKSTQWAKVAFLFRTTLTQGRSHAHDKHQQE